MNLKKFPRHALTFGPTPIQPLHALSEAPWRQGRALRQARGLQ